MTRPIWKIFANALWLGNRCGRGGSLDCRSAVDQSVLCDEVGESEAGGQVAATRRGSVGCRRRLATQALELHAVSSTRSGSEPRCRGCATGLLWAAHPSICTVRPIKAVTLIAACVAIASACASAVRRPKKLPKLQSRST